ncbi:MAG: M48 family metallopeptidase, partial [Rhodocyclales bacterium]|nr:M48 family metallopeptidase [Rhodocyclales bacterium]
MTPLEGSYYDGKSSRQHRVTIHREAPGHLRVTGEGIDFSCRLSEVRASSRLGNTRRYLAFADGSRCEVDDNDAIDALFYDAPKAGLGRLLHHFETRLGYVLLALLLTVVALWAGVVHGIPALAKGIAFNLPVATDRMLGEEALTGLDATLLEPTRLPPRRQMELRTLFADMTAGIPGAAGYRIELRASKAIGANALALPSGLVVMTDSLVELAACDDELVAVLAHEIGHLEQRHGLR